MYIYRDVWSDSTKQNLCTLFNWICSMATPMQWAPVEQAEEMEKDGPCEPSTWHDQSSTVLDVYPWISWTSMTIINIQQYPVQSINSPILHQPGMRPSLSAVQWGPEKSSRCSIKKQHLNKTYSMPNKREHRSQLSSVSPLNHRWNLVICPKMETPQTSPKTEDSIRLIIFHPYKCSHHLPSVSISFHHSIV